MQLRKKIEDFCYTPFTLYRGTLYVKIHFSIRHVALFINFIIHTKKYWKFIYGLYLNISVKNFAKACTFRPK